MVGEGGDEEMCERVMKSEVWMKITLMGIACFCDEMVVGIFPNMLREEQISH